MATIVNNTILHSSKLPREQFLKVHITRKNILYLCVVLDVNETYCGDHFTKHTTIKSLHYIPETNIELYVNYTPIKKGRFEKELNRTYTSKNYSKCL